MNKILLLCFVVVTIFILNNSCFAEEERSHNKKDHICFRTVDEDKDGKVTFQEFMKVFGEDKKKFEAIDQDDDGNLSHDEYRQSLCREAK